MGGTESQKGENNKTDALRARANTASEAAVYAQAHTRYGNEAREGRRELWLQSPRP